MVDVETLEAKTARLREQAAKLHQADAEAGADAYRKVGQQKDEANQQLRAAQEAVKAAESQAKEQHAKAQELEQQASDLEEGAKDEWNKLERISEHDLEQAQKYRAVAAAASERAAENHRAVARHQAEAQRLEREIADLQTTLDLGNTPTERLADQIDDMVDRGAQAVRWLREAERLEAAGDPAGAAAIRSVANDELTLLEQIRPDYASVDPAVLASAGITAADRDLLDPTVLPDPDLGSEVDPVPADPPHIEMEPEAMRPADRTLMASPDQAPPDATDPDAGGSQVTHPITPVAASNMQPATRIVGTGPDSDGDGLSDDFETNVFLSDPNEKDVDGDGLSDWAEYWLDTDPKQADSDGDGWEDGEDLAFGDPLRQNAGGAARADFVRRAREQFEREGSDRDRDLVRDHLEKQLGTKADDADSDGDGLGDMVELQLGTDPLSPAGSTADLDTARARLDPRRAVSDAPPAPAEESSNDLPDRDVQEDLTVPEEPAPQEPTFEEPSFVEPVPDEIAFAEPDAIDPAPDAAEGEAFDA